MAWDLDEVCEVDGFLRAWCRLLCKRERLTPATMRKLSLAPLPATARVTLTRRDLRTHAIDDARALRYEGRVTVEGKLQIE